MPQDLYPTTLRPTTCTLCPPTGEAFLLSPTAILVALHSLSAGPGSSAGVALPAVMGALNVCLAQREVFTHEALAAALFILVDRCAFELKHYGLKVSRVFAI